MKVLVRSPSLQPGDVVQGSAQGSSQGPHVVIQLEEERKVPVSNFSCELQHSDKKWHAGWTTSFRMEMFYSYKNVILH